MVESKIPLIVKKTNQYILVINNKEVYGSYYFKRTLEYASAMKGITNIIYKRGWIKKKLLLVPPRKIGKDMTPLPKNAIEIDPQTFINEKKQEEKNRNTKKEINYNKIIGEVRNLVLGFKNSANPNIFNKVIRNTSFKVHEGEVVGIIGESGSGKSVISSTLYGLTGNGSSIQSGQVIVNGIRVEKFSQKDWEKKDLRGKTVSAVFQNPMTTLDPTMKVGKQIAEGIIVNKLAGNKKEAYELALKYLRKTKVNRPELVMNMYPHSLSGGMKQRAVIAAIIACKPKLIIFDEPTTALDPTVQAEILEIIKELIIETKTAAIFITHDLGVVASISDKICIMYAGQIIESGTTEEILFNPRHPYTWGLLGSMPDVNIGDRLKTIQGSVPGSLNRITWDAFADRNDFAMDIDFSEEPPIFKISKTHYAKTWLLDKRAPKVEPPDLILKRWENFENRKKQVDNV